MCRVGEGVVIVKDPMDAAGPIEPGSLWRVELSPAPRGGEIIVMAIAETPLAEEAIVHASRRAWRCLTLLNSTCQASMGVGQTRHLPIGVEPWRSLL
jgi:hypothetical protein